MGGLGRWATGRKGRGRGAEGQAARADVSGLEPAPHPAIEREITRTLDRRPAARLRRADAFSHASRKELGERMRSTQSGHWIFLWSQGPKFHIAIR